MVEEYYRRNREIVDNSDMVYAFIAPDGIDRGGTWYTINYAKLKGKEVILR
jgi:nucleoside 2-deoxyribosyltransferase